jgi:hypothetical protein
MPERSAYLYYEAGQAVAAAHLGLTIRRVSGNPAESASEIVLPRGDLKARLILWLTAIAAESKGAGRSDPLRRMRNRTRVKAHLDEIVAMQDGTPARRLAAARRLRAQAQDRANAIASDLFPAIERVASRIETAGTLSGSEVVDIVRAVKAERDGRKSRDGQMQ